MKWEDSIRYAAIPRYAWAWATFLRAVAFRDPSRRLAAFAEAHRIAMGLNLPSPSESGLRKWIEEPDQARVWRDRRIGWSRYEVDVVERTMKKSLIARLPGAGNKGVLMVWFEYDLLSLLACPRLESILERYQVAFFSSWSPPFFPALWAFPHRYRKEFVSGISYERDRQSIPSAGFQTEILPLYMSNWQEPGDFRPRPRDRRDVDIVMVANWAKFKRHWVLFEALRQLDRPELRVVLIGQPESGRGVEEVRAEADSFGVVDQIEFLNRLPVKEVWAWLERARISMITSRREGSCVVVAESLMADTPVALLENAEIGSASFLNEQTGVFLREGSDLGAQLGAFLDRSDEMEARTWAMNNISRQDALRTLQDSFSQWQGIPDDRGGWLPVCCRGTLGYDALAEEDREALDRELEWFRVEQGLQFPRAES